MKMWILTSSILILAVLVIRAVGQDKLSARVRYALWGLVLLRLLIPGSVGTSALSVWNVVPQDVLQTNFSVIAQNRQNHAQQKSELPVVSDITESSEVSMPSDTSQTTQTGVATQPTESTVRYEPAEQAVSAPSRNGSFILTIWGLGMAVMAAVFVLSNLRFSLKLRRSRRLVETGVVSVYETAAVETPCLFGFVRPAVYVTPDVLADETILRHVLAHELTHYRHKDHIWSLLRCVCVTLHWYNPLVWVAAFVSQQDAELACDEGAVQRIGEAERTDYARTLLELSCGSYKGMLTTATSMTGNESTLKTRILRIAKNPQMPKIAIPVILVLALVIGLVVFTGEKKNPLEGVWVMDYEETYPSPEFKRQGRAILEFQDGIVREEHYFDGEHSHTYEYAYRIEDDTVYYQLTYADRVAYQYRYELTGRKLTLYRENGLPYGTYTPYERPDNVFCTDQIEHITKVEMYRNGIAMECVGSSGEFTGNRILGILQSCKIADAYPAPSAVAAEHVYCITMETDEMSRELLYADGVIYMDGTAYKTDAAEELNALFLGTMWQPVGGYVDENGETYTHVPVSDGVPYIWLDMISGYGDSRIYVPENRSDWQEAIEELAEHRVAVGDGIEVDHNGVESLSVWGTDRWSSITVYSDGNIFFWENLGNGESCEYRVLGADAPKLMALAAPYLEIAERSRKESAGDINCDGTWVMNQPHGQVKYIRMTLDGDAKYAALSASGGTYSAQVGEQVITSHFDFYVRDGLFHVRWNDLTEETFPCVAEENRLTITAYGTDWVFEPMTEANKPQIRQDILRSDNLAVELSEETVAKLEALLRDGVGEEIGNIIFKQEYFYYLPALYEAFGSEPVVLTDYGTFHYANQAYKLTNWEDVKAFLDTIYTVKY